MNKEQIISLWVFGIPILIIVSAVVIIRWKCFFNNHDIEFVNNVNGWLPKCKRCGKIIR